MYNMPYLINPFRKSLISTFVLVAVVTPVSIALADNSISSEGACSWTIVMNDKGEVYETGYYCDNPVGNIDPQDPACTEQPDGNNICNLPSNTPNTPEQKKESQVQQSSSSSEEHRSEAVQTTSQKKGKVKGISIVNKRISIEKFINALHRIVFGRNPSPSEHAYWMTRIKDKPTLAQMLGAMQFHKMHNITH